MKRQAREVYGFLPQRRDRFPRLARLVLGAFILATVAGVLLWN